MADPFRPRYYILNADGDPEPCDALLTWAAWMEANQQNRQVSDDYDEGDPEKKIRVSTVFLGLDHRHFGEGPPILYETLVFGGALDGTMERYATREEAAIGHQEMCARVTAALPPR